MTGQLSGKAALVTGSTSGIGLGIARALAAAGADLTLNGFGEPAAIERTRAELAAASGVRVRYSGADMSKGEEVEPMVRDGRGGVRRGSTSWSTTPASSTSRRSRSSRRRSGRRSSRSTCRSNYYAIHAALPGMRRRGFGRIVNLASAHGLVASPYKAAYVAAKHGVVGLTKVVALETAEENITCNAICPGFVATPLVEGQIDEQAKAHGMPRERVISEVILGLPAEQALRRGRGARRARACSCAPTAGRSITGAALPVDGGWTAR